MKCRQFAVLDRDGTIIIERHYLSEPGEIEFLPGAVRGLRQMNAMELGLIVITNHCLCRKPSPGLVQQAARELHFDLEASFVIGDKTIDIEMGRRVKATTFLVRPGYGNEAARNATVTPDYIVDDLAAAQTIQDLMRETGKSIGHDH